MVLKIELLDGQRHIRSDFSCGKDSLDTYLCKQATQDLKRKVATIFVLVDHPQMLVLGYYTLSAYTVHISALGEEFAKHLSRYPALPATLLGRLAVDHGQRGKRFGEFLLMDALKRSLDTTSQIASLAVIAEALDGEALRFYLRYGFRQFNQHPMKLYLPMKLVAGLFAR
ncbi:MAG: GNAT family N-acetyltransferase [Gloeomargaritaceae cyanobacterium C42_A2020_066]|nr:GNAT family N-acetyltransferase [Gloeomargaritaceae cyanobacterium C42_A2020_066]